MAEATEASRKLGVYYTPGVVAQAIVDWAIWDSSCTVLDPSFGGCAFFRASMNTLLRRGASRPGRLLYGVDIDPTARTFLKPLLCAGARTSQFHTGDFLALDATQLSAAPFDVVVGNPPYVRHHWINQKPSLRKRFVSQNGSKIVDGRASYWAYFLLHSLKFIAPKGRLAFILPISLLHADYSAKVWQEVTNSFRSITLIVVGERIFPQAEEATLILLAKGRGLNTQEIRLGAAHSVADISDICRRIRHRTRRVSSSENYQEWRSALLDPCVLELYRDLQRDARTVSLDRLASVRIGTVTGCNKLFVLTESRCKSLAIPTTWRYPIVCRASHLPALTFQKRDHNYLGRSGKAVQLLLVREHPRASQMLRNYLGKAKKEGIADRFKCRARDTWYRLERINVPDAFLHYMSADLPHLVLNKAAATSTNTIHQLFWKERLSSRQQQFVALSSISTLFQLSAELAGRSYGGGVLKLELKEARKLLLASPFRVPPGISDQFPLMDSLLRAGERQKAIEFADRIILRSTLKRSSGEIRRLVEALGSLRRIRLGFRKM